MSRSDRSALAALAALLMAAASHAMGGCSDPTTTPCDFCSPSQICAADECVTRCNSNGDCAPGHRCAAAPSGVFVCSTGCDATLCAMRGERFDCRGNACVTVTCSDRVPCADPTSVCDIDGRCVARDGTCARGLVDCPHLAPAVSDVAVASCSGAGVCRVTLAPHFVVPTTAEVRVTRPDDAHRLYASAADVRFAWTPQPHPQIVLVLGRVPSGAADLAGAAIWGAVVPAGAGSVAWSAGHDIANGAWLSTRADPPRDRALYLLVQAVDAGALRGESALAPFAIGDRAPWSAPGASCDAKRRCDAVVYPLVCVRAQCQIACASDEDCRASGRSTCADPTDGVRACE